MPAPAPDTPEAAAAATPAAAGGAVPPEQQALHDAMAQLLAPVARLAVERGLPFAAAQELLKLAFVQAAAAAHPNLPPHRKVSRIATSTGINRREVTRLTAPAAARSKSHAAHAASAAPAAPASGPEAPRAGARAIGRSAAAEICAHWRTHAPWRSDDGMPRTLPRIGPAPSFEALAAEITRDVHPRSLLEELCRLGLAEHDPATDTVALAGDASVPRGDRARMLGVLGANVGAHLNAAVDNVLATGTPPHLEQALFADGLSAASLEALRPLLREQWARLRQTLVPAIEQRLAQDAGGSGPRANLRLGLYAHADTPAEHAAPGALAKPGAKLGDKAGGKAGDQAGGKAGGKASEQPGPSAGEPAPRPRRITRRAARAGNLPPPPPTPEQ